MKMMRASDVNETWFNPTYVVSFTWGEYRSLTLRMVDGSDICVPRGADCARVYKALTGEFWK